MKKSLAVGSIVSHRSELWRVIDIDESSDVVKVWLVGVTNPDMDVFATREHISIVEE